MSSVCRAPGIDQTTIPGLETDLVSTKPEPECRFFHLGRWKRRQGRRKHVIHHSCIKISPEISPSTFLQLLRDLPCAIFIKPTLLFHYRRSKASRKIRKSYQKLLVINSFSIVLKGKKWKTVIGQTFVCKCKTCEVLFIKHNHIEIDAINCGGHKFLITKRLHTRQGSSDVSNWCVLRPMFHFVWKTILNFHLEDFNYTREVSKKLDWFFFFFFPSKKEKERQYVDWSADMPQQSNCYRNFECITKGNRTLDHFYRRRSKSLFFFNICIY